MRRLATSPSPRYWLKGAISAWVRRISSTVGMSYTRTTGLILSICASQPRSSSSVFIMPPTMAR